MDGNDESRCYLDTRISSELNENEDYGNLTYFLLSQIFLAICYSIKKKKKNICSSFVEYVGPKQWQRQIKSSFASGNPLALCELTEMDYYSKNIFLCLSEERKSYASGMAWVWVNERIFIFEMFVFKDGSRFNSLDIINSTEKQTRMKHQCHPLP